MLPRAMNVKDLSGHARPSESLRRQLGIIHGPKAVVRMDELLNDAQAIESLAKLLKVSFEKSVKKDGRVDWRDVSALVLAEMKANQR